MWESYYDTTSDIDQTETELFNWEHQTSPDTAPHSRRPLSIGPAPAYKYLSASPPSTFGDKRSSPVYSNKAEFERHQEKVSQQQHHVLNVEMNHAQPIYTAIPTAISIETSTYHGPDHQPHFQAATHPGYHSQYVQHPVNEQHVAHGLSTSAPEAGEPWNMHHQHHQQQQSRAPNWTYPGMPGALGRPASSGDQAVMAQGVGLIRYTSEETVAELTKEEKRARRKEQNRLAQQDLRRRRMEHTANLETRVEELVRTLEKKDHEIRMLQDIVRQLQRGGKPVTGIPELSLNGSLHPSAVKEEYGPTVSALASPIQPIQRLQPSLHIATGADGADRLGPLSRPIVKRNVSDDEARGLRVDMDMQPPSYSPASLTATTSTSDATIPGTYVEHQAHPRQAIWSAPAGVVEFPSDVQQHPSHHPHPLTPQQHAGGVKVQADRRASIVGYTGFEPYPQAGKLGLNVSGTGRPTSSQQYQQKQHYQTNQHVPGYAPMIMGYPPKSGLDTPPNGGPGGQTQTQTSTQTQAQIQTRNDYDYSLFHTSTSGASRAHPPNSQEKQQLQHMHRMKPESASACPSDISASSSVMPLELDVDEAVNVNQAGYEHRTDRFVYPVNQVFPSPNQHQSGR